MLINTNCDRCQNPQNYYNRPVAVKGKVEQVIANNAFTFSEYNPNLLTVGKDLLVLSVAPQPTPKTDAKIFARGRVCPFNIAELERDYNSNLNPDLKKRLESEYSQQVVLVIDNIAPANMDFSDTEIDTDIETQP